MDLQDITFDEYTEQHRRGHLDAIRAWAESRELPGPVQLEIGSTRGRFLRGLAALYPAKSIVGIELRRSFVEALEPVLKRLGPTNAHILSADANLALPMLFADGTLERGLCALSRSVVEKTARQAPPLDPHVSGSSGGQDRRRQHLIIKTDVEPYAEVIRRTDRGHAALATRPARRCRLAQ